MKHVGWVKRAKPSTTAPPPAARNPSIAQSINHPQPINRPRHDFALIQNHRVFDDAASERLGVQDAPTSEPWVLAAAVQNSAVA